MSNKAQLMKPIIRVTIALISLAIINFIILKLPGLSKIHVPGVTLPYSIPEIITAILSTVMIIIVLKFGFDFGPAVQNAFPKFPEMRAVAMNAVFLLVIFIAYSSYREILYPLLSGEYWIYDLVFFLVALIPTYIIATTLMKNTDKWTTHIYTNVEEAVGEFIDCPKCGIKNDVSNKFCKSCGAKIEFLKKSVFCGQCGGMIEPNAKYCPNCGNERRNKV